jgi:hypothetical protein
MQNYGPLSPRFRSAGMYGGVPVGELGTLSEERIYYVRAHLPRRASRDRESRTRSRRRNAR